MESLSNSGAAKQVLRDRVLGMAGLIDDAGLEKLIYKDREGKVLSYAEALAGPGLVESVSWPAPPVPVAPVAPATPVPVPATPVPVPVQSTTGTK